MWQRFSLTLLLALFLLVGLAWAQGRDDLKDRGQQQPLRTDMVGNDQRLDLSIDKYTSQAKDKEAATVTDSKKNTGRGSSKTKSVKPSSREDMILNAQPKGPQVGALGSGLLDKGFKQSSSSDSKSFLDGYLLKSLHKDSIPREKTKAEKKPKENMPPRGKISYEFSRDAVF